MKPPTLLLIDWQQAFRDTAVFGKPSDNGARDNAKLLLDHWRTQRWSVVHIQHASTGAMSPLRPDQPGYAFEPFAEPIGDEPVVVKSVNSAFIDTDLEQLLVDTGCEALVVSGATTDHCVSTTVRMAANLGFAVVVANDAVLSVPRRSSDGSVLDAELVHAVTLASLADEFAQFATTQTLLERDWDA